ncbi:DUF2007 domain-containing protein [Candidatus Poribacteria bacterium]|jgi:hypothetical protein|nr:DUF2007 domain-containing protein [Candidatus Poribacteria bacterium]MBT5533678.1 DUF2007 domain-containing protein [Candidatus Poribacteria bacterium]MBT5712312.1 DUF2007 domain-containing protein [Candidatus Poribacteria bacterium]MBT7097634.1 DUF2007 domain-containing protein [Candidatus Poribacteria bacterium]MBT7804305.1 DUF2007 domain-containing protein [Candidatus Poribacteria bacterium]
MRSCPACGTEYTDKAVVCSDCQASLVDGPAEATPDSSVEFVRWERVYGPPDQVAALMLQGVLEAEEIPVRVEASTMAAYGALRSSLKADSWGALLVPAERAEEATRLIEEYLQGIDADPPPSDDTDANA